MNQEHKNIVEAIKNNNIPLLLSSINIDSVNAILFKRGDDNRPTWSPLIYVSNTNRIRVDNLRYNGISSNITEQDDCEVAKILLDNGANINERCLSSKNTALMYTIYHQNLYLFRLLIERGADLNITNNNGSTALMIAYAHQSTDYFKHSKTMIDELLAADADTKIKDHNGESFPLREYNLEHLI